MRNKITQEHYLVVYQKKEDLDKFFNDKKEESTKYVANIKTRTLTTIPKHDTDVQYKFYGVRYDGDCDQFMMQICGAQFVGVCYLDGNYPANVFNYSLYRCRGGGVWEVDRI